MNAVEVVLANNDRVTLRVGETYVKVDADRSRSDKEAEAIERAPIPVPEIRWRQPSVLAMAGLPGRTLGRLGEPDSASTEAWVAVGAVLRTLHDAPLPPWPDKTNAELEARIDDGCAWLLAHDVLTPEVIERNRTLARCVVRPHELAFVHGDLHIEHVFVEGDRVTGFIDWSEARQGDGTYDIATLALGHPERLEDLLRGYGREVDLDVVRGWWSWRCLGSIRWLVENGYGEAETLPETEVLRAQV